jgi:hypothetical protein
MLYELLTAQFSLKVLSSSLFSNTAKSCSFFKVGDHVTHPYKVTRECISLYCMIFTILESTVWADNMYVVSRVGWYA